MASGDGEPIKLDNFAFQGWQGCPLWYKTRIVDGWTSRGRSGALGFGGAMHEGLAAWYKTRDPEAAVAAIERVWPEDHPYDDFRDLMKAKRTMLEYIDKYMFESFKIIPGMVEIAAALPTGMYLPQCQSPGCGFMNVEGINDWDRTKSECGNCGGPLEPIEYGGIFDTLIEFGDQVYILEHKTTSAMGPTFFNQFKPNNQVTGYVWMAKSMSGRCDGALINAIGVFKASATRFERHITTRDDHDIERWLNDLWHEACAIRQHELSGHWPIRSQRCTLYGKCEFHDVHVIGDPAVQQRFLEQEYVQSRWEFEKRDV